jgi:hypothetical protein
VKIEFTHDDSFGGHGVNPNDCVLRRPHLQSCGNGTSSRQQIVAVRGDPRVTVEMADSVMDNVLQVG